MRKILFFDTETTKFPEWKLPSGHGAQPHLVQLATIVADADSRKVLSSFDLTIRPDGWIIEQDAFEVHGIDAAQAEAIGVPEVLAVELFIEAVCGVSLVVAHNSPFDQRIMRIALKRYGFELSAESWALANHYCTMKESKKIVNATNEKGGIKNPRLGEAYEYFFDKPLLNAHTAMADAEGCMAVYWAIQDNLAVPAAPSVIF